MFGLSDRGNKNKVNLVWVMFGYNWMCKAAIDKKLQTYEKLRRWLANPNMNFNGTYEPRSAVKSQTRPPMKN